MKKSELVMKTTLRNLRSIRDLLRAASETEDGESAIEAANLAAMKMDFLAEFLGYSIEEEQ